MSGTKEETRPQRAEQALEEIEALRKTVEHLEERIDRLTQQMADLEARIHEEVE